MGSFTLVPNATGQSDPSAQNRFHIYVQSGVLFAFFTLALIGNTAIVARLWYHGLKTSHKMSNVALLCFNLALADLVAAFCCILSNAILYLVETFSAGNVTCKLLRFLQRLGLAASTFIVVTISIDRCAAVWFPMRRTYLWRTRVLFMIGIWLLAACFSIPQVIIFKVAPSVSVHGNDIFECSGFDESGEWWGEFLYALTNLVFFYIVPIIAVIASYALIFGKINQNATFSASESQALPHHYKKNYESDGQLSAHRDRGDSAVSGKRHALYLRARNTSLVVSLVVVATFVICWAPYYISSVIHLVTKPGRGDSYHYSHAIYFCGLGHSVLNPIIYGAFHVIKRSRSAKPTDIRASGDMKSHRRSSIPQTIFSKSLSTGKSAG